MFFLDLRLRMKPFWGERIVNRPLGEQLFGGQLFAGASTQEQAICVYSDHLDYVVLLNPLQFGRWVALRLCSMSRAWGAPHHNPA